jgi:hypothetical protein
MFETKVVDYLLGALEDPLLPLLAGPSHSVLFSNEIGSYLA